MTRDDRSSMPLHIPDYRADTGHLSTLEHGAYLLLIMHYWIRGGLPGDDARLARITGMTLQEWTEAKPAMEPLFTADWRHKRVDAELRKVRLSEVRASAGQAGAAVTNGSQILPPAKIETASLLEDSKKKKVRERGARLASDWTPSEADITAAKAEGLSESEAKREAAKFRDYWIAKPGAAGVKLDWQATWRNWCRRSAEYLGRKPIAETKKLENIDWEKHVQFFKQVGKWSHQLGGEPGSIACRVPADILKKYGYQAHVAHETTEAA
jgi:uncharacterized protein YdaU (DUF1376 family)